jgi:hypothetical protein
MSHSIFSSKQKKGNVCVAENNNCIK